MATKDRKIERMLSESQLKERKKEKRKKAV